MGMYPPLPTDMQNLPQAPGYGFPGQQAAVNPFPPGIDGGVPIAPAIAADPNSVPMMGGAAYPAQQDFPQQFAPQQAPQFAPAPGLPPAPGAMAPMPGQMAPPAPMYPQAPQFAPQPVQQFAPQNQALQGVGGFPPPPAGTPVATGPAPAEVVKTAKELEAEIKLINDPNALQPYFSDQRKSVQKAVQKRYNELTGAAPAPAGGTGGGDTSNEDGLLLALAHRIIELLS